MHDSWKALRQRIMEYLERTSIEDLAKALDQKKRNLEKVRKGSRSTTKKS
jgi:DNA-binding IscR family transcriptional regulator